jgi:hypothetical protein
LAAVLVIAGLLARSEARRPATAGGSGPVPGSPQPQRESQPASVAPPLGASIAPPPSADKAAARHVAQTYVDALTTGNADVAWRLLSNWSKKTVGSFATFGDAEGRLHEFDPAKPSIGEPRRDRALLDRAVLGTPGDDVAASGGLTRALVVTVGD